MDKLYKNINNSLCLQQMEENINGICIPKMVYCKHYNDKLYTTYRFYKPITRLFGLFLLLFINTIVWSQNELQNPYAFVKDESVNYRSLKKLIDNDTLYVGSQFEDSYDDLLSVLYSRVGHYKDAMQYAKRGHLFSNNMRFVSQFSNVIAIPLSTIMDSIIKNNQVIMFNEMHFNPNSRSFVISWLKKCYENGYRYLAAETLYAKDSLLNERRTVLLGKTGFYCDEPVFGDLLRTALNLGYELVPYESSDFKRREECQSENLIKNIVEKDPQAKFLLLGGMGHIADRNGWYTMGRYFKDQSGIDPFTLECIFFCDQYECADSLTESFFKYIDKMPESQPVLCYDTVLNKYLSFSGMDATCCLPRTHFIEDNIPDWKMYNGKVLYKIDRRFIKKYGFPEGCVSAFLKSEGELCVPVDQYMYNVDETEFKLALYKGEYILRFDNGYSYRYKKIKIK